ncbi:hypothetical protein [Streptomyces boninensis]|uniref:hypothetical protein n=1 Tax=Streptomyces boninensis TaxID=2039455 RepID=UPI003B21A292
MPVRYHLRFQLHPDDAVRQAAELAKFCHDATIGEVVLLLAAEEFYDGHPAGAAEDRLYATTAEAVAVLRESGLEVSLNPWVTSGHGDRGRQGRHGFAPMVGPDGSTATDQASFACPRWRSWVTAHYGRFAQLGFRVLWLEDDFRYHNHAPLTWGGGFEPLMLERFAELAGEPVTRERLVAAITAPGTPHPWRALLQQVWRTAQLEVAGQLAAAVAEGSGGRSRLGLMSSRPGTHSVEGRDWTALFEALAIDGEAYHRPHFAAYSDTPGRTLSRSVWMLETQRALRPAWARNEPEIENWTHTSWSKSDTQTWSEMAAAQLGGADAQFLNVLPMHCGRADRHPRVGELLRRSRPALDFLADLPPATGTLGVGLPVREDQAAHVRTTTGSLAGLEADPGPAADFLLRYGVPVTAGDDAPVRVLFGQLAWAYDDEEVRRMLGGGLLLDGVAARILTERGFAELMGVSATAVEGRGALTEPGPYAVEQVLPGIGFDGLDDYLSVNVQPALARLRPADGARVWTQVLTAGLEPWGAGRCVFTNSLGGRVGVLAATAPEQLPYSDDGQAVLHAMIRYLEGDSPAFPLITGGPHLIPHLARTPTGWQLAVANGSPDPAQPRVDLPSGAGAAHATLLAPLQPPAAAALTAAAGGIAADEPLPYRGWLVIEGA